MKTYITLIAISGLKRADLTREREPIAEGEVIELPDGFAKSLLRTGAIEPSDAAITVDLHWDRPAELIKSNDVDALVKAVGALKDKDLKRFPSEMKVQAVGIAPTDHQALAQALEAAGATVVLPGEEWPVSLDKVDQPLLLAEVARRVSKGDIAAAQLPEEVLGLAAQGLSAKLQDQAGKVEPAIVDGTSATVENSEAAIKQVEQTAPKAVEPAAAKPAKPPRKRG